MNQVWHFIKLAVSVIAGIASAVCLFVAPQLVVPTAIVSIAFSQMPE
jgi:hypothetical protein